MTTIPDHNSFLPYSLPEYEVLEKLHTSEGGLSEDEAERRYRKYGANTLTEKKKLSAINIFLDQFKNSLTLILLGAIVLIFFIYFFGGRDQSDLIEAALIFAIILMITILGFFQEFKAEKALDSLKKLMSFRAKVRRNGQEREIDIKFIVPGDILILEEGLKIPADMRLLKAIDLFTNESSLTGESTTIEKSSKPLPRTTETADQNNMVFAGTGVTAGRGIGVVVKTGNYTEIGKIAKVVAAESTEATPLQRHLDEIGKQIGYIVIAISIIVFIFIAFFADNYNSLPLLQKIVQSFIAAVALAVAAIPEGLPAVVTIALAMGTQRMAKKNALVRRLSSVETLGAVNIICTDKTGTLTKNEMTVRELYFSGRMYEVTGTGFETTGKFLLDDTAVNPQDMRLLFEAGFYCNNASLNNGIYLGDPTEAALLVSAEKASIESEADRVWEIPFSSERKFMSVVVKKSNQYILFAKGAPEIILQHCSTFAIDGKQEEIDLEVRKDIIRSIVAMNSRALRTLGFAYRVMSESEFEELKVDDALENDLIFIGLQGMIDPAREEVKPLIEQCKHSGIRVIMLTGDHEETARAIAKEIGIDGDLLTGSELDRMSEDELAKVVNHIGVYARINPSSKMAIVQALKKKGNVVAMTGDGVNDAPALKKADIGIAMGITGTDVAKEAADIVLLDDKFSTIVHAIEEGRGIFQNIRKFVQYLLSCNIGEVLFVFFGILIFRDLPLTATMLLWINVVTDGLPAVALAMDRPKKNIVSVSPREFQTGILTRRVWIEMIFFACIFTALTIGLYALDFNRNIIEARGAAFIAVAFFELVYLFVIRKTYDIPFFSNKWLIRIIFGTIILQVAIVYIPILANLFNLKFISVFDWVYILFATGVIWLFFVGLLKKKELK